MFKTASADQRSNRQHTAHASGNGGLVLRFMAGTLLTLAFASARADASPEGNRSPTLSYVTLHSADLAKLGLIATSQAPPVKQHSRRIPTLTLLSQLADRELIAGAVPLPEADTLAGRNFFEGRFGRIQTESDVRWFNPEIILVKFRNARHVAARRPFKTPLPSRFASPWNH